MAVLGSSTQAPGILFWAALSAASPFRPVVLPPMPTAEWFCCLSRVCAGGVPRTGPAPALGVGLILLGLPVDLNGFSGVGLRCWLVVHPALSLAVPSPTPGWLGPALGPNCPFLPRWLVGGDVLCGRVLLGDGDGAIFIISFNSFSPQHVSDLVQLFLVGTALASGKSHLGRPGGSRWASVCQSL